MKKFADFDGLLDPIAEEPFEVVYGVMIEKTSWSCTIQAFPCVATRRGAAVLGLAVWVDAQRFEARGQRVLCWASYVAKGGHVVID